ncbi:MAG: hypothetical protein ACLVGA_13445 [Dysosmobacter sp.]
MGRSESTQQQTRCRPAQVKGRVDHRRGVPFLTVEQRTSSTAHAAAA